MGYQRLSAKSDSNKNRLKIMNGNQYTLSSLSSMPWDIIEGVETFDDSSMSSSYPTRAWEWSLNDSPIKRVILLTN